MTEKKDQYVIAYISDYLYSDTVLSYAMYLSNMLNKGLMLLRIIDPKYTRETIEEAELRLKEIQARIAIPQSIICSVLEGTTREIITRMPVAFEAVVIVGVVDKTARKTPIASKEILKNFSECKIAFLMVQQKLVCVESLKNVGLTIDFHKESKDKLIWASYFNRFNGSLIHVLYNDYSDEFLRTKWFNNLKFLDKIFSNLGVQYQKHVLGKQSQYIDVNALEYASKNQIGLLVSVTTKERDVLEYFTGVQENKTIINSHQIPILYLNPREDLYVLCD